MILVDLKRSNGEPLFAQVANQIVVLIGSGSLKVGDRLPSTRSLSEQLKVNRSTVCRAYEELAAMGYTESSPGGYTTIRRRMAISSSHSVEVPEGNEPHWQPSRTLTEVEELLDRHTCSDHSFTGIDFRPLSPDPQLMPVDDFRRAMDRVLAKSGISLLAYGDEKGYGPLRAMVAGHMQQHCVTASEENIVLTESVQNGLDLMLRLAVRPGDRVAVEMPTYNMVIPLLRCHGAQVVAIPMREDGMCLDSLERAMQEAPLSLVYTMPNFHNPTGITTGQEHRERLLQLCERHNVLILEDGFEEELKYNGRVVLPIKSMDRKGMVVYLGTFSKTLFPGVRVGWMVADSRIVRQLHVLKRTCEFAMPIVCQAAVYQLLKEGKYGLHIKRMHRIYRKRMDAALRAIGRYIPEGVAVVKPNGGYSIWMELEGSTIGEEELLSALRGKGVAVSAGSLFYIDSADKTCFRISIGHLNEEAIEEGIRRIGQVLFDLITNSKINDERNIHSER